MPALTTTPWICPLCHQPADTRFVLSSDGKPITLAGISPEACFRCTATLSPHLPHYIPDTLLIPADGE